MSYTFDVVKERSRVERLNADLLESIKNLVEECEHWFPAHSAEAYVALQSAKKAIAKAESR